MNERGVSAVVAVVLTVAITIAGVFIFWAGVRPLFDTNIGEVDFDISLEIVPSSEYTAWDSVNRLSMVQVGRGADEHDLVGLDLIYYFGKRSVKHYVWVAPEINVARTYYVNLSGYTDELFSIGVAPIFGDGKEGRVVSQLSVDDISSVNISDLINSGKVSGSLFEKPNEGVVGAMSYGIHFTGFEGGGVSPWDGWVGGGADCIYSSTVNYCSNVSCPGIGTYSIEVQDDTATSVLYQSFDFSAPCGGNVCDSINFSFWVYPNSYDGVDEGWDVFCDYASGDEANIVHWAEDGTGCDVVGGVNVCEDVWTEIVVDLVGAGCMIDSDVELMFTGQASVTGLGNADQIYIDGINVTGYRGG